MQIKARTKPGVERFRRAGFRFDFRIRPYDVTEEQLAILRAESMIQICDDGAVVCIQEEIQFSAPSDEQVKDDDKLKEVEEAAVRDAADRETERNMNSERKAAARDSEGSEDEDVWDFAELNVGALRALAKEQGIDPKQNKPELVAALEAASE